MSAPSPKINVYSLSDLKNTTDDALPNYLSSLKFKESHFYTDVRLGIGYTAVLIAATTFYFDYTLGWEKTKFATLWAVIGYFILNTALTYWIWGVEKGKVYVGTFKGTELTIQSSVDKHVPIYHLRVKYLLPGKSDYHVLSLQAPFMKWFSEDGFLVAKPFQQWLATEIPVIGSADPKNVVKGEAITLEARASGVSGVLSEIQGSSKRSTKGAR
ncbi:MAG: hypothetical protein M1814_004461 [Vezdaea aestivalis]|nr:MAG: hypothetical protein M1814_004461 [Vezdaea aestivalis]